MIGKFYFGKHVSYLLIILSMLSWRVSAQQNGTFVDARDGHVYKWVKIGDQVWMAENLAYLPHVYSPYDKTIQPQKPGSAEVDKVVMNSPFQFVYGYDGNNVDNAKKSEAFQIYGVIYNFASANKSCPSGWHLPSDEEWKQLEIMAGMDSKEIDELKFPRGNISDKLKNKLYWSDQSRGTDVYGLGLSPGGILFVSPDIDKGARFSDMGNGGYFWSSTERIHHMFGDRQAIIRTVIDVDNFELEAGNKQIGRYPMAKFSGLSVRCVKD